MLDQAARSAVQMIYRDHMIATLGYNIANCSSAEEIITLARNLNSPDYEAGQGWRTVPPFPGAYDTPVEVPPHWRMVTACHLLDRDDQELGVFYVTFVSGKPSAVVLSGAGTEIPNHYVRSSNQLSGRVAIVTGAAGGVGAAIVRDLIACGARVVAADNGSSIDGRSEDPAPIAALAAACGDAVVPMAQSIAAPGFADAAVALAYERFGGLDIIVNNAAILRDAFLFKGSRADFEAVVAIDLTAAFELLRAATPVLRENAKQSRGGSPYAWGRIVTIGSTAALYGNYGQAAYASAKAGLFGLMRVAALDMARSGVTSNMIAPFAASRVTETIVPATPAQAAYKAAALAIPAAPIGRFTSFLCSARAGRITGQVFGVRGRETFVFSQPRPAARATTGPDPSLDDLAALVEAEFAPHFTALETDLDAFSTNPVP